MSRTLDMHKNKSLVKCRSLRVTVREKGLWGPIFFYFSSICRCFLVDLTISRVMAGFTFVEIYDILYILQFF